MIKEIESICEIKCEEDLTKYNTYRVNSICHALVFPKSIKELKEVLIQNLPKLNTELQLLVGEFLNLENK